MVVNPNDETNFLHKLLLTNTHVANLQKAFANKSSTDIKLSKTQLSKMIQQGGIQLLGPFLKTGLPLMKNVIKALAEIVLIPLGLTAGASAADVRIHKKILDSGKPPLDLALPNNTTKLITSNEEMEDIIERS